MQLSSEAQFSAPVIIQEVLPFFAKEIFGHNGRKITSYRSEFATPLQGGDEQKARNVFFFCS